MKLSLIAVFGLLATSGFANTCVELCTFGNHRRPLPKCLERCEQFAGDEVSIAHDYLSYSNYFMSPYAIEEALKKTRSNVYRKVAEGCGNFPKRISPLHNEEIKGGYTAVFRDTYVFYTCSTL